MTFPLALVLKENDLSREPTPEDFTFPERVKIYLTLKSCIEDAKATLARTPREESAAVSTCLRRLQEDYAAFSQALVV